MGLLIDGKWSDTWYETHEHGGRFVRPETQFRDWVSSESDAKFRPEANRYVLIVSYACPWAHRTLIARKLKRLESVLEVSVVHPLMLDQGWKFDPSFPGATADPLFGAPFLHSIYARARSEYSGRVTVPVLWDKVHKTVVNNESSELLRMFNRVFDGLEGAGNPALDLYPAELAEEIDATNEGVYHAVNNGVYRCGFATTQTAYEEAFGLLFTQLDALDARLAKQRYLVGKQLTEADIRLFTTLVRFDAVYVGHFKCNQRRIADYPALSGYLRDIYQWPGVAETVRLDHIKTHYYASHRNINPTGVVPLGPALDFAAPHGRGDL